MHIMSLSSGIAALELRWRIEVSSSRPFLHNLSAPQERQRQLGVQTDEGI